MSRIAIATDSNSGITQAQAKELGIFVLPMPFYINDELFLEDITLTQEQFYQKMEEGADVKTTQPAPGDVIEFWDKLLRDYDEIVQIPMSSGLSSTCETAEMLSEDYGGKVQVVNNQRISVTQRQSALDALALANAGWSAREIKELLEKTKFDSDIYITVDTLKYLKKGGRCTPAAAAIGTVLGIKPVLRIKGEKLDSFAKARGWKAAKKTMVDTARKVMDTDFADCHGPADLHIAVVLDFGHDLEGGKRGMAALVRIERRDAHETMHSLFRLQVAVGVFALDLKIDALDARFVAVEAVELGHFESAALRVAGVHAVEHGDPVAAFGAARTRMQR